MDSKILIVEVKQSIMLSETGLAYILTKHAIKVITTTNDTNFFANDRMKLS